MRTSRCAPPVPPPAPPLLALALAVSKHILRHRPPSPCTQGQFDVVLASDVLWVLGTWRPLVATARSLLANPKNAEFLIAETGHEQLALPAALASFRAVAESGGLAIDYGDVPLPLVVDGYDAQLVTLKRRP